MYCSQHIACVVSTAEGSATYLHVLRVHICVHSPGSRLKQRSARFQQKEHSLLKTQTIQFWNNDLCLFSKMKWL